VLLAAVRAGDESAFLQLAATHHAALRRVAMAHGAGAASADEVVHQTWREVLRRLDSFDGQPSLRSWAARIASGCARARVLSDQGLEPFASLPKAASEPGRPAVAADRFLPRGHPEIPGHWALVPTPWSALRNGSFPGAARAVLTSAVEELPAAEQLVISLRDVEGWSAREVCDAFDVSETDERVLLHRARSCVRAALELHFGGEGQAGISQQS
jgi:RNA polymerase sigma-70 factor (ECF subfamily)